MCRRYLDGPPPASSGRLRVVAGIDFPCAHPADWREGQRFQTG